MEAAESRYHRTLPLHISRRASTHAIQNVTVDISVETSKMPTQRSLLIRLTDVEDPFFLFTLELSEEDFAAVKRAQDLKVDFAAFPTSLAELMDRCAAEAAHATPKYLAQLEMPGEDGASARGAAATLSVVETNAFKNLVHISLRCLPGNDAALKTYLAGCLRSARDEGATATRELERLKKDLTLRLQQTEELLRTRTEEAISLRAQMAAGSEQQRAEYERVVAMERERAAATLAQMQERLGQDGRDRHDRAQAHAASLERRLAEMTSSHASLTERLHRAELHEKDLTVRCESGEAAAAATRAEMAALEAENRRLMEEKRALSSLVEEKERECAALTAHVQRLAAEGEEKNRLLLSGQEDRERMAAAASAARERIGAQEEGLRTAAGEIAKGNSIIRHLQDDIRAMRARLKAKNDVTIAQEARVQAIETELLNARRNLSTLEQRTQVAENERERVQQALVAARTQLDEKARQLKDTESAVLYLQKQNDVHRHSLPPSSSSPYDTHTAYPLTHTTTHAPSLPLSSFPLPSSRPPLSVLGGGEVNARQVIFKPKGKATPDVPISQDTQLDAKYFTADNATDTHAPLRSRLPQPLSSKATTPPQHGPSSSSGPHAAADATGLVPASDAAGKGSIRSLIAQQQ